MGSTRDRIIALRQARIAYAMARRRLARLNGEPSSGHKRGAALQDCYKARRNLEREAAYTHGWLRGRESARIGEWMGGYMATPKHIASIQAELAAVRAAKGAK